MLWEHGVQIGKRSDPMHNIQLYQIEGFYVEVFFNNEDSSVEHLRSFRSTGQLRPFLEKSIFLISPNYFSPAFASSLYCRIICCMLLQLLLETSAVLI